MVGQPRKILHRRCPRVELDDLISAGTIGLINAVDRFRPEPESETEDSPSTGSAERCSTTCDTSTSTEKRRRSQKQQEAVIDQLSATGEVPLYFGDRSGSRCFIKQVCDAFANDHGIGPISTHESAVASELTG
jgi:Sigma-70 region 2